MSADPLRARCDCVEYGTGLSLCKKCGAFTAMSAAIGLFWQTADGKWHFSPGSTKRGDIHDNGRPIRVAYLGEEAK